MWLYAENIRCTHGFSTRQGGVSNHPFNALNLGGSEDTQENILENRKLALDNLNLSIDNLCYLKQVHGTDVCVAQKGKQTGDALVTNKENFILTVSAADCYPILFLDEKNSVIGAAHAGWRGTCGKIVKNVLNAMEEMGAHIPNIKVAIGQGICQQNFEVGCEVISAFEEAGFPNTCWSENKIDLVKSNIFALKQGGVLPENIWSMNRCTFEDDFFSHRRDKGKTGRMWGLISLTKNK
jgi:YfiH family protein